MSERCGASAAVPRARPKNESSLYWTKSWGSSLYWTESSLYWTESSLYWTESSLYWTECVQYNEDSVQYNEDSVQYNEDSVQYNEDSVQYNEHFLFCTSRRKHRAAVPCRGTSWGSVEARSMLPGLPSFTYPRPRKHDVMRVTRAVWICMDMHHTTTLAPYHVISSHSMQQPS